MTFSYKIALLWIKECHNSGVVLRKKAWYSHYDIFIPLSLVFCSNLAKFVTNSVESIGFEGLSLVVSIAANTHGFSPFLKEKWLFNPSYIVRFLVERPPQILFLLSVFDLSKIRLRHTIKRSFYVIPCTFCNGYTHLPVLGCNVSKRRIFARSEAF